METLTNEEMLEIEGGDWYGIGSALMSAFVTAFASL